MVTYPRQPHGVREPRLVRDLAERNLAWMAKCARVGPWAATARKPLRPSTRLRRPRPREIIPGFPGPARHQPQKRRTCHETHWHSLRPGTLVSRSRSSSASTARARTWSPSPSSSGGISLDSPRRYDLILDRISQDIPFYRAILKKAVADGTIVVNNPFWWSADDKFFNNVAGAPRRRRRAEDGDPALEPASARHDRGVDVEPRLPARVGRDVPVHRLPGVLQALLRRRLEERLPGDESARVLRGLPGDRART